MPDAQETFGTVFKNGSATLLARIVGANGAVVGRTDLGAAKYTVWRLDENDPDAAAAVAGHQDVALAVAAVVFDALQLDPLWNADAVGYNFRHALDVVANPAFPTAGVHYRVEYTLTPLAGQPIVVRFRLYAV